SASDVPRLVASNWPSHAYGSSLAALTAAKNQVVVPTKVTGSSRSGSSSCIIGGPPACDTKLVKPATAGQNRARAADSGCGGPVQAREPSENLSSANTIASRPISAVIQRASTTRNNSVPSA